MFVSHISGRIPTADRPFTPRAYPPPPKEIPNTLQELRKHRPTQRCFFVLCAEARTGDIMNIRNSIILIAAFLLISLIPATVPGQTCIPVPSGAVSWWSAEGDGNDRYGRNNTVLVGDTVFVPGKVGQAFSFDGSGDYAQAAATSSLPVGAAPRTVELWFRAPATPGESGLFQYGAANTGNMFGLITSGNAPGKLYFYGHSADLPGTTTIAPNIWYHGAVTYDGTTVKLYLNGQLENQAAIG